MKRIAAVLMSLIVAVSATASALALTDARIFSDPVESTYTGRVEASQMISNLNFTDLAPDAASKESVIRMGAFNLVKGYGPNYNPSTPVSNQEALAFVLRAVGQEETAQNLALTIQPTMPEDTDLRTLWSLGYLERSRQMSLITQTQFDDSTTPDQSQLEPANAFMRGDPATREHVLDWVVRALEFTDSNAFTTTATQQSIYAHPDWDTLSINAFPDWETLSVNLVANVEKALKAGFMQGIVTDKLDPKGRVTRAEMAQILRNMDTVYFNIEGLTKKTGTVGGIKDEQTTSTGTGALTRDIYVRSASGGIDVLRHTYKKDSSPQSGKMDMVVFKNGAVTSLTALAEGDEIEYIVREQDKVGFYVQVVASPLSSKTVQGVWDSTDWTGGTVTVTDPTDKKYTYPMINGIFGTDEDGTQFVFVDGKKRVGSGIPVGSIVELSLKNNVVDSIRYIGNLTLAAEARGIVVENNPSMGYLMYTGNNGFPALGYYYDDEISVKKLPHYEKEDTLGYIAQMFPDFRYNPTDAGISDIEPGDIVFMRFEDPSDPELITAISASPSYVVKHAKIVKLADNGDYFTLTVEYENKSTSWFDVPYDMFIVKDGLPISISEVVAGDWAQLLVNVAVLEPGNVWESLKEMKIEGDAHYISNIIRGQLTGINSVQNLLLIQNAQTLSKTGWGSHKNVDQFSVAGKDIEYYQDGKRISLDYATQYLKRAKGEVYIALENNYSGEKVRKVTFRTERDELLKPDTVMSADGLGGFTILSNNGQVTTDAGTIVRRHGRLVSGSDIQAYDYAVVALNGQNRAAVVDIYDAPATSGVYIYRARVKSVDDGKSFTAQSIAMLNIMEWDYSPIERTFTIDYNTVFKDADGNIVPNDSFISYGDASVFDKVYTVVATGSHADLVVLAPYSTRGVRGTVYRAGGGQVGLKDASYYNNTTGQWLPVSGSNSTLVVTIPDTAVIVSNNALVPQSELKVGDKIKAMTESLPAKVTPGLEVPGYIVHVEK